MKITDISKLVVNQVYNLQDTQFNVTKKVRCLGNYGVGEKVYFTDADSNETPETLTEKFKANRLPNAFVCWDYMLRLNYIVTPVSNIQCEHCNSENVRSVDNQPLYHPSKEEVAKDVPNFDNEIYVEFYCDDCGKTHDKVFSLLLK